jgi:hypothetical protein
LLPAEPMSSDPLPSDRRPQRAFSRCHRSAQLPCSSQLFSRYALLADNTLRIRDPISPSPRGFRGGQFRQVTKARRNGKAGSGRDS